MLPNGGSLRGQGFGKGIAPAGSGGKPAMALQGGNSVLGGARRSSGERGESTLDGLGGGKSHAAGALRTVAAGPSTPPPQNSMPKVQMPKLPAPPQLKMSSAVQGLFKGIKGFGRTAWKVTPKSLRVGVPLVGGVGLLGYGASRTVREGKNLARGHQAESPANQNRQRLYDAQRYGVDPSQYQPQQPATPPQY